MILELFFCVFRALAWFCLLIPRSRTSFIVVEEREEPVLGIQLKNIIPLKVYEKNLTDKAYTENLKEHFSEFPSFLYKTYTEEDIGRGNEYLDYKYPREKILLIIAKNQYADGSFAKTGETDISKIIETTAMTTLAFVLGSEDIKIYVNQLNKSADFLLKYFDDLILKENEKLNSLVNFSLQFCLRKRILKGKVLEAALNKLSDVQEINFKNQLISMFSISENGDAIEETIIIKNEKESIFDFAKLAVLKAL